MGSAKGSPRGKPELSKETFQAKLEGDQTEYLRAGDLGFLHNGELYVVDGYQHRVSVFHGASGRFLRAIGGAGELTSPFGCLVVRGLLLVSEAGSFVNGATLRVDGGWMSRAY